MNEKKYFSSPLPQSLAANVLPKDGEKNVLITSALPYSNNVPHLGNIIGSLLSADVYARYCRLCGYNTLFICGTDEYGTATETKAIQEGMTPKQICDKYFVIHQKVYKWFDIEFDHFGRTSNEHQQKITHDIFHKLNKNDYVFEKTIQQLYCQNCSRFLADRYIEGTCPKCGCTNAKGDQCDECQTLITDILNPRCKLCQSEPIFKSTRHMFLSLDKLSPNLNDFMRQGTNWTNNAINQTKSFIDSGLLPRCITRDLKWGTSVPLEGYDKKVFYVWFDACIGYMSITADYTEQWEKWWKNPENVKLVQFMGKDNILFHTVVFPATLIGTRDNWTMLNQLSATEYLTFNAEKFSKSKNIGVFGDQLITSGVSSDSMRYCLLRQRPETSDSDFSWESFKNLNNSELLNQIGNLIHRCLSFCQKNFDGFVSSPSKYLTNDDHIAIKNIEKITQIYIDNMESLKLRSALDNVIEIVKLINNYFQSMKPWSIMSTNQSRARCVIDLTFCFIRHLCSLLEPFVPNLCAKAFHQMNVCEAISIKSIIDLKINDNHKIGDLCPLVKRID